MDSRALSGLLLAIVSILLAAVSAAAATDLHPLLAAPPGADWIDVPSSSTDLTGDFTAHEYAASVGGNSGIEFDLNLYGFTRGYALEWAQRGSNDLLVERVFEFRDAKGCAVLVHPAEAHR